MSRGRTSFTLITLFAAVLLAGVYFVTAVQSQDQPADEQPQAELTEPLAVQAPSAILFNYQGRLLNKNQNPVNNNGLPMIFEIFPAATGGSSCWKETHSGGNAVKVQDGVFQLVLGQITTIPISCPSGDPYLQLTVNGEVMAPRERLTTVAKAVRAESLSGGATVAGDLRVDNNIVNGGVNFYMRDTGDTNVALRAVGSERTLHLLPWGGSRYTYDQVCIGCGSAANFRVNGHTTMHGNLNLLGSCSAASLNALGTSTSVSESCSGGNLTTAAVIEANLQTQEELASKRIERFSEGDLLCWAGEQLEVCSKANDRAVQAVADPDGRPIVIGAEPIKVTGKVELNDILVTSSKPGHAMVNNDPAPGTVIGQALEPFSGGSGLIKAMIRKW